MTLCHIHRASVLGLSPAQLRISCSASVLAIRPSISRDHHPCDVQARSLWWWGSRHGNEWSSSVDEHLEERLQRHQRIMRYRYSKALRRRAMWDRDDSIRTWGWRLRRSWIGNRTQNLSSGAPLQAHVQERDNPPPESPRKWRAWDKDFEKFKDDVDKAIDRDPYGTLFGRRLRSPLYENNSSWTSFSWIFEPMRPAELHPIKDDPAFSPKSEPERSKPSDSIETSKPTIFSVPPKAPANIKMDNVAQESKEQYEYDPITMRKVLKAKAIESETSPRESQESDLASKPPEKKPFLSALFSEHGVDIPVKTYKPHRVYGYGESNEGESAFPKSSTIAQARGSKRIVESSRQAEIKALKAKTLGCNIDTTAEYYGKYQPKEDAKPALLTGKRRGARAPEIDDNIPLFSGTTYESRSTNIFVSRSGQKHDWLLKEGFRTLPEVFSAGQSKSAGPASNSSRSQDELPPEIEPSIDMTQASKPSISANKSTTRMEPALDRAIGARGPSGRPESQPKLSAITKVDPVKEVLEDLDALRASDIRAASRATRETKESVQTTEGRGKLQPALPRIGEKAAEESSTASKLSTGLRNVWNHVKEFPHGIVARTVQSMGMFNENYKSYVRLDKPVQDSTAKLVFQDESLGRTLSIYKKVTRMSGKPLQTFTPSQEVIDAERESQARSAALRQANEDAKREELKLQIQAKELAKEIREAYEREYGPIDINHRQGQPCADAKEEQEVPEVKSVSKTPHPLMTATLSTDAVRDPVTEDHVSRFEPKFASLVDQAKQTRQTLREVSRHLRAIKSQWPATYWNAGPKKVETVNPADLVGVEAEVKPVSPVVEETQKVETEKANERKTIRDIRMIMVPKASPKAIITLNVTEAVPEVKKRNSTYIILAYDPATNVINESPMESSSQGPATQKEVEVGLAELLTKLTHPAQFLPSITELHEAGYALSSGGGDMLIFKKIEKPSAPVTATTIPPVERVAIDKNTIAANEATSTQAATVLDEIPDVVYPSPGPSAPIAPPAAANITSQKVRRQEDVFSASPTSRAKTSSSSETTVPSAAAEEPIVQKAKKDSFFKRLRRGVTRVLLTGLAMGSLAYGIGVAADSIGPDRRYTQQEIEGMRRRGRAGIYSTESSR